MIIHRVSWVSKHTSFLSNIGLISIILIFSCFMVSSGTNCNLATSCLEEPLIAESVADPVNESGQNNLISHDPLSSLEDLLRGESNLLSSFESLLNSTDTTVDERVMFLDSFEDLLRRQAVLFSGFESLLKSQWYNLDCEEQRKFLYSFEDLLHREMALYSSFNNLTQESWGSISREEQVKLLGSFEDLLRRQSNLLKSFEDLFKMTYGGLTLEKYADKTCVYPGDTVTYRYVLKNWYNGAMSNVTVVDSQLGIIARRINLAPGELRTLSRTARLTGCTCNIAKAYGGGPCGEMLYEESNMVCVELIKVGRNVDVITTGRQETLTAGSDPPSAFNTVDIKKNQKSACSEDTVLYNLENIQLGDQTSKGVSTGSSGNTIKIVASQG
jgi:hypothetical protein